MKYEDAIKVRTGSGRLIIDATPSQLARIARGEVDGVTQRQILAALVIIAHDYVCGDGTVEEWLARQR